MLVKESLRELRRIIFNLRPMALDDLGLVPTLNRYLENSAGAGGGAGQPDGKGLRRLAWFDAGGGGLSYGARGCQQRPKARSGGTIQVTSVCR